MRARPMSDEVAIEVVELLVLAADSCRMADGLVSAAVERLVGGEVDVAELRRHAARFADMLGRLDHHGAQAR